MVKKQKKGNLAGKKRQHGCAQIVGCARVRDKRTGIVCGEYHILVSSLDFRLTQ